MCVCVCEREREREREGGRERGSIFYTIREIRRTRDNQKRQDATRANTLTQNLF